MNLVSKCSMSKGALSREMVFWARVSLTLPGDDQFKLTKDHLSPIFEKFSILISGI